MVLRPIIRSRCFCVFDVRDRRAQVRGRRRPGKRGRGLVRQEEGVMYILRLNHAKAVAYNLKFQVSVKLRSMAGSTGCGQTTAREARACFRPAQQARRGSSRISSPSSPRTGVQGPAAVPPGVGAADARRFPCRSRTLTRSSAWSCTTSGP
jgi:hypothetical protein